MTPPSLERVVKRCLAKHPDERWQTAQDLADELRWIGQAGAGPAIAAPPARPARWRIGAIAAALVVLTAAATAMVLRTLWSRSAPAPVLRAQLDVAPADELVSSPNPGGPLTSLAWTPDGRTLVFVGRKGGVQQLFARALDRGEARALAGTEGAAGPVVSADGQSVMFVDLPGREIKKAPLAGGPAISVATGVVAFRGMAWGDQGRLVFHDRRDGRLWQVVSGRQPVPLTFLEPDERMHTLPHLLPSETAVLYTSRKRDNTWGDERIVAHVLATGERKVLLENATDARYLPPGHLLFLRLGVLLAVSFDPGRLEVTGEPVPLLDGVAQALGANLTPAGGAGQFAVAPTGTLAYLPGPISAWREATLVSVNRQGRVTSLSAPARAYTIGLACSPDGRRLAVAVGSLGEISLCTVVLSGTSGSSTPRARR